MPDLRRRLEFLSASKVDGGLTVRDLREFVEALNSAGVDDDAAVIMDTADQVRVVVDASLWLDDETE